MCAPPSKATTLFASVEDAAVCRSSVSSLDTQRRGGHTGSGCLGRAGASSRFGGRLCHCEAREPIPIPALSHAPKSSMSNTFADLAPCAFRQTPALRHSKPCLSLGVARRHECLRWSQSSVRSDIIEQLGAPVRQSPPPLDPPWPRRLRWARLRAPAAYAAGRSRSRRACTRRTVPCVQHSKGLLPHLLETTGLAAIGADGRAPSAGAGALTPNSWTVACHVRERRQLEQAVHAHTWAMARSATSFEPRSAVDSDFACARFSHAAHQLAAHLVCAAVCGHDRHGRRDWRGRGRRCRPRDRRAEDARCGSGRRPFLTPIVVSARGCRHGRCRCGWRRRCRWHCGRGLGDGGCARRLRRGPFLAPVIVGRSNLRQRGRHGRWVHNS
jgi:hypothetical protein